MKKTVAAGTFVAGLALALGLNAQAIEAQSPEQFVGKWTIAFAPGGPGGGMGAGRPGGAGGGGGGGGGGGMGGPGARGGPMVLEVRMDAGKLVATMTGGMGGGGQARTIENVQIANGALVLTYAMNMMQGGQAAPVTLKLIPDGAATRAEMQVADRPARTGTATKE